MNTVISPEEQTRLIGKKRIKEWFDEVVATIRSDELMLEKNLASSRKRKNVLKPNAR